MILRKRIKERISLRPELIFRVATCRPSTTSNTSPDVPSSVRLSSRAGRRRGVISFQMPYSLIEGHLHLEATPKYQNYPLPNPNHIRKFLCCL